MNSLSRRAKIIIGIVLGIIVVAGGILFYLQRTGKISIFAATTPITVTPRNISTEVGTTSTIRVSPAKIFTATCIGTSPNNTPLKTVEVVGGTDSARWISTRYFRTLTSSFGIKAVAEGTARCDLVNFKPKTGQIRIGNPYSVTINIGPAFTGGTTTGDGTTGGTGTTTITTDPTSLTLRHNTTQTVYLLGAGSVVTVKCSNGAQAWNGSTAGVTMTFRPTGTNTIVQNIGIKAAPSAASSVCLLYQSTTTTGTPAGQVPVTTYD